MAYIVKGPSSVSVTINASATSFTASKNPNLEKNRDPVALENCSPRYPLHARGASLLTTRRAGIDYSSSTSTQAVGKGE